MKTVEDVLNQDYYNYLMRSSFDIGYENKLLIKEAMMEYAQIATNEKDGLINKLQMDICIKQDKIDLLQERVGDTEDRHYLSIRIHNSLSKELERQKKEGKIFISDQEIDDLINDIMKREIEK